MNKLKNNPVAKALLQSDRRRTQFVPDKKKPNRNKLKYEDLKLKKEWEGKSVDNINIPLDELKQKQIQGLNESGRNSLVIEEKPKKKKNSGLDS